LNSRKNLLPSDLRVRCSFRGIRVVRGYHRFAQALAAAIGDRLGERGVEVELLKDDGATGNFEVHLGTGELVHSKATGGQGRCETAEETEAVIAKILAYLEAL